MLVPLPDGHTAEAVRDALAATGQQLPQHLWKSLTWDQGKETAQHAQFTIDTGVDLYFSTPRAHGSAAPTRTPTDSSVNTSPKTPTCPSPPKKTSTPQPTNSTGASDKPSDGRHHQTSPPKGCNDPLRPQALWAGGSAGFDYRLYFDRDTHRQRGDTYC